MAEPREMPEFRPLRPDKPGFRGHMLEAMGSMLWTLLFLSHLSSAISHSYGRGISAWQTVPLCALPVIFAGLPGAIEGRRGARVALVVHASYALAPGIALLLAPKSLPAHAISAALVHIPLALGLLPSNLSATGSVTAWDGLSAALVGLNSFTVIAPLDRSVGFTFHGEFTDVAVVFVCAMLALSSGLAVARFVGFAEYQLPRKMDMSRELAICAGLYLSGLCEEVLFRGVLLNLTLQWLGGNEVIAIALSSVAFGLAHLRRDKHGFRPPNWRFAITASVFGFSCGLAWVKSGRVTVSALVNATFHYALRTILKKTSVE